MERNPVSRGHLSLLPGRLEERLPWSCTTPGCEERAQTSSGLCAACELADRVDLDALAPVMAAIDVILDPIVGLSRALRDRVALVAAVWLQEENSDGSDGGLEQALGQGLLDAALVARNAPRPAS